LSHSAFQRIWLPGFLLQSVIIGGGYATGRELVEFFLGSGPTGGLLGMLVATVLFSFASALCFELARLTRSFNYRSLLQQLLGKGWFVYEIAYFVSACSCLPSSVPPPANLQQSTWGCTRFWPPCCSWH